MARTAARACFPVGEERRCQLAADRAFVEWQDVSLAWLRSAWYQVPGGTVTALLAALKAHSNAGELGHALGAWSVVAGAPVDAQYPALLDLAQLRFCTAAPREVQLLIPCPKSGIFLPGSREVDPAQIADVLAAAVGTLSDDAGLPVVSFSGGSLLSRRRDQP